MTTLLQILILLADNFSGPVNVLLASVIDLGSFLMDSDMPGIVFAAAVIMASDGVTEVIRILTTRLNNCITSPPARAASCSSSRQLS